MHKDDAIRLRHMLDAVREAQGFAASRSRCDLDHDRLLVLALVKDVEIIGEAASRVPGGTTRYRPPKKSRSTCAAWVEVTTRPSRRS